MEKPVVRDVLRALPERRAVLLAVRVVRRADDLRPRVVLREVLRAVRAFVDVPPARRERLRVFRLT